MIAVCVFFSALRIRKFYRSNFPVAEAGECISMKVPNAGVANARVIGNYSDKAASLLIIYSVNNQPIFFPVFLSYLTQRTYDAEKVLCP